MFYVDVGVNRILFLLTFTSTGNQENSFCLSPFLNPDAGLRIAVDTSEVLDLPLVAYFAPLPTTKERQRAWCASRATHVSGPEGAGRNYHRCRTSFVSSCNSHAYRSGFTVTVAEPFSFRHFSMMATAILQHCAIILASSVAVMVNPYQRYLALSTFIFAENQK